MTQGARNFTMTPHLDGGCFGAQRWRIATDIDRPSQTTTDHVFTTEKDAQHAIDFAYWYYHLVKDEREREIINFIQGY